MHDIMYPVIEWSSCPPSWKGGPGGVALPFRSGRAGSVGGSILFLFEDLFFLGW